MSFSSYFITLMVFLAINTYLQFYLYEKTGKNYHKILGVITFVFTLINFIAAWVMLSFERKGLL
jgi:hypothetical protein